MVNYAYDAEAIHEYATERLSACGEAESIRILHADYFANLAEAADAEIYTSRQGYWFVRLRDELDNLRSILTWSLNGNENEYGLRLAAALHTFWAYDGLGAEGNRWTDLALTRSTMLPAAAASRSLDTSLINALPAREELHQALELQQVETERN
jgi:predicted ATPase